MRDGGLGPGLGHFWQSQSYREIPSCWSSLTKLCSKGSSILLLPFEHSFVSELQQEGISRHDRDFQKCPRPGPKPPSRIHYSNQTDHPKHPPPAPLRLGRLPQVPKTALCLVVQLEVAWLASIEADTARSPGYFLRLRTFGPRSRATPS